MLIASSMRPHVPSAAPGLCRFQWAYQQLVDLRYEWAVPSDVRAKPLPGSPTPDALYYLDEEELSGNASARPDGSLRYYVAALEDNALNATNQLFVAGAAAANLSCRDPIMPRCCGVVHAGRCMQQGRLRLPAHVMHRGHCQQPV